MPGRSPAKSATGKNTAIRRFAAGEGPARAFEPSIATTVPMIM
ncbi:MULTISPECIES: hypothetical protein [unclassified Streptomyces]|nr:MULTISPECIES: hypothetical protein [unclassified Streptomyces]